MPGLLERFALTLSETEAGDILARVEDFARWRAAACPAEGMGRPAEFTPTGSDDVPLRTYLLELRHASRLPPDQGGARADLEQQLSALRRFYTWARTEGLIDENPFDGHNFDRLQLPRDQIRRRQDALATDADTRELAHLRALNRLSEHLNRSANLRPMIDTALGILVETLSLQAAWIFLHAGCGLTAYLGDGPAAHPHDYVLAAARGLPPGLEADDRRPLRAPPDCHCQQLLRQGQLVRAVNIIECTRVADAAGDSQGLLFHASVPLLAAGQPLGILNVATQDWQFLSAGDLQLLSAAGAQLALALERTRLYEAAREQQLRLEGELEMARAVQACLLPARLPQLAGYSLAAHWQSAREVAGDFYDVFPLPGGRWALVIADVSDKGAAAALYMAMTRSLIRAHADQLATPAATLQDVNQALLAQSSATMFVTGIYAVFDPAAHSLTWASAGHNPPYLRRAEGGVERLPAGGIALGIHDRIRLADHARQLAPGEAVLLYTDGLTDALDPGEQEYGAGRAAAVMAGAPPAASNLLAHLLQDLEAFTLAAPQTDDITLLAVARHAG